MHAYGKLKKADKYQWNGTRESLSTFMWEFESECGKAQCIELFKGLLKDPESYPKIDVADEATTADDIQRAIYYDRMRSKYTNQDAAMESLLRDMLTGVAKQRYKKEGLHGYKGFLFITGAFDTIDESKIKLARKRVTQALVWTGAKSLERYFISIEQEVNEVDKIAKAIIEDKNCLLDDYGKPVDDAIRQDYANEVNP